MSSTNIINITKLEELAMSLTYKINSNGPNMGHCGFQNIISNKT